MSVNMLHSVTAQQPASQVSILSRGTKTGGSLAKTSSSCPGTLSPLAVTAAGWAGLGWAVPCSSVVLRKGVTSVWYRCPALPHLCDAVALELHPEASKAGMFVAHQRNRCAAAGCPVLKILRLLV